MFEFITVGNRILDQGNITGNAIDLMLNFLSYDFNYLFVAIRKTADLKQEISPEISSLLNERQTARQVKDWEKSDLLRKKLLEIGIEVQDTPMGQKWRKSAKAA